MTHWRAGDRVQHKVSGDGGTITEVDYADTYQTYKVEWDRLPNIDPRWEMTRDLVSPEDDGPDLVNHPAHYNQGKIEVIDFIEDQGLEYHESNALKYISRAGKKSEATRIQDLEKAVWYLNRKITLLRGESNG